jgi:hypothetical protein
VVNNSGSGTVGGDDPATVSNGTIVVSGISEANNYSITFTAPCASLVISGNAPTCDPLPAVVINEVDYDNPGTDSQEFIELRNNDAVPWNLFNYKVQLVNGSGTAVYQTYTLPSVSLAPGDFYVLCQVSSTVPNCDLAVIPDNAPNGTVQNGSPDAVALRDQNDNLIDVISYEGTTGAPYNEGGGTTLADVNAAGSTTVSIGRVPDGQDTNNNTADWQLLCVYSPGRRTRHRSIPMVT